MTTRGEEKHQGKTGTLSTSIPKVFVHHYNLRYSLEIDQFEQLVQIHQKYTNT